MIREMLNDEYHHEDKVEVATSVSPVKKDNQEPIVIGSSSFSVEFSESIYWKVDNSIPLDANDILNYYLYP